MRGDELESRLPYSHITLGQVQSVTVVADVQ